MLKKSKILLALKTAVERERSMWPLSELYIVLSSRLYHELDTNELVYGCKVVECEYLGSNEILISRKYGVEEFI